MWPRKLGAKSAVPRFEGTDGAQEVNAAEVGPECFFEVKLRLRALPEQKARQPLLAGGSDD
jgi:hypothetical protein